MRIYSKSFDKVTEKEERCINLLTLPDSLFRLDVLRTSKDKSDFQFFLAKEAGIVVGWVVAFPSEHSIEHSYSAWSPVPAMRVYLYVRDSVRRQGIGKKLLKKSVKWVEDQECGAKVYGWDTRSRGFFNFCKESKYKMEICRQ
jgi:GNAT superfamily N-acetyltransferase